MPSAPIALPRRAVRGDDSSLSPTMNSTAATRYVSEMTRAMLRVGSGLMSNGSGELRTASCAVLPFAWRCGAAEHSQHPVGHEESAHDVDRRQSDGGDAEDEVVGRAEAPRDEDRPDHRDAGD